ncbi:hypothetical protein [Spiroplasma endosymbiont of Aspidapion aeneum]|uniref:hypothetical protein n=1 Tax=Spiroplasma endosymbiont of Aspidapion aeneum TaxID=3066276 RepID=UPI00313F14FD
MSNTQKEIRSFFTSIPRLILDEIDSRMDNFISPYTIKKYVHHYKELTENDLELILKYISLRAEVNFEYYERYKSFFDNPEPTKINFNASNKINKPLEVKYQKGIIHRESEIEKEMVRDESKMYVRHYNTLTNVTKFFLSDNPKNAIRKDLNPKPKEKIIKEKVDKEKVIISKPIKEEKIVKDSVVMKINSIKANVNANKKNLTNYKSNKQTIDYQWNKVPDLSIEREYDQSVLEKKSSTSSVVIPKTKKSIIADKRPNIKIDDFEEKEITNVNSKTSKKAIKANKTNKNNIENNNKTININDKKTKQNIIKVEKIDQQKIIEDISIAMPTKVTTNNAKSFKKPKFIEKEINKEKNGPVKPFDKRNIILIEREYDESILTQKLEIKKTKNKQEIYKWDKKPDLKNL